MSSTRFGRSPRACIRKRRVRTAPLTTYTGPATPWMNQFRPFAILTPDQFHADPPPALDSAQWAADYNEVKAFGAASTLPNSRTPEQEEIGLFYGAINAMLQVQRNLQKVAMEQDLTADLGRRRALWHRRLLRSPIRSSDAGSRSTRTTSGGRSPQSSTATSTATTRPMRTRSGCLRSSRPHIPSTRRRMAAGLRRTRMRSVLLRHQTAAGRHHADGRGGTSRSSLRQHGRDHQGNHRRARVQRRSLPDVGRRRRRSWVEKWLSGWRSSTSSRRARTFRKGRRRTHETRCGDGGASLTRPVAPRQCSRTTESV